MQRVDSHIQVISQPRSAKRLSARQWRSTRRRVAGGYGVVNVDDQARVGWLVGAGNGHQVGGKRAGTAADGELGARNVQLGTTNGAGAVKANVLDTQQVVATRDALGDLDVEDLLAYFTRRQSPLPADFARRAGNEDSPCDGHVMPWPVMPGLSW